MSNKRFVNRKQNILEISERESSGNKNILENIQIIKRLYKDRYKISFLHYNVLSILVVSIYRRLHP